MVSFSAMDIPRLIIVLLLSFAFAKAGTDCDVFRVGLDDLIDRSAMVVKARIDRLIEYKPVWPRTAVTVTDVLRGSRRGLPKEVTVSGLNSAALCTQGAERGEEYYMFLSKCDEVDCAVTFQGLEVRSSSCMWGHLYRQAGGRGYWSAASVYICSC